LDQGASNDSETASPEGARLGSCGASRRQSSCLRHRAPPTPWNPGGTPRPYSVRPVVGGRRSRGMVKTTCRCRTGASKSRLNHSAQSTRSAPGSAPTGRRGPNPARALSRASSSPGPAGARPSTSASARSTAPSTGARSSARRRSARAPGPRTRRSARSASGRRRRPPARASRPSATAGGSPSARSWRPSPSA
jgi:hypothetical protein